MTGRWGSATMVVIAGAAMALGAGIWRHSIQAKAAPEPVPAAAPNSPPPAPAPSANDATAKPGASEAGVAAEFQALIESFGKKVKTATDRQQFAQQLTTALQQFIQRHPQDPVSDQARITLGKVQLSLQEPAAAVETFRQTAEHPADRRLASPARFYLAQAFAAAGQVDAARQTLVELSKTAENDKIRQAARSVLNRLQAQQEAAEAVSIGKAPPAIEGNDLTGQPQSLDQYHGKVLLLDFWATWCGPCRAELPNVKAVYRKYKERGFAVLGVSLDENRSALKGVLREEQMEWPQLCDGKGWRSPIAQRYGVTSIPRTVLLDRDGVVRYVDVRGEALNQAVAELLGPPAR
jgi:peroxiredoxin/TolA-binding protein